VGESRLVSSGVEDGMRHCGGGARSHAVELNVFEVAATPVVDEHGDEGGPNEGDDDDEDGDDDTIGELHGEYRGCLL